MIDSLPSDLYTIIVKMKSCSFKYMRYYDLVAACLLLFSVIFYVVVYVTMSSIAPEIQQAANFDYSSWIILLLVLFAIVFLLFFAISSFQWFELVMASNNKIVQELIYILGLGESDEEKEEHLEQTLQAIPVDIVKDSDSMESIYGFGHDENQKWTYAGKKPKVAATVADEKTNEAERTDSLEENGAIESNDN